MNSIRGGVNVRHLSLLCPRAIQVQCRRLRRWGAGGLGDHQERVLVDPGFGRVLEGHQELALALPLTFLVQHPHPPLWLKPDVDLFANFVVLLFVNLDHLAFCKLATRSCTQWPKFYWPSKILHTVAQIRLALSILLHSVFITSNEFQATVPGKKHNPMNIRPLCQGKI